MTSTGQGSIYGRFFGEFLMEKRVITPSQLREALLVQQASRKPIGLLAVDFGYLRSDQLLSLLELQRRSDLDLGRLAVDQAWLTQAQVDFLLAQQSLSHIHLGETLVRLGLVSLQRLEALLHAFHPENEDLARTLEDSFGHLAQGDILQSLVEIAHRLLFRVIGGHVRVRRIEPNGFGLPTGDEVVRISRTGPPMVLDYGLSLGRPCALSLVYCLLRKSTWSERLLRETLAEFAEALDFALIRRLTQKGVQLPPPAVEFVNHPDIPLSRTACVLLTSSIGDFWLLFIPGPEPSR